MSKYDEHMRAAEELLEQAAGPGGLTQPDRQVPWLIGRAQAHATLALAAATSPLEAAKPEGDTAMGSDASTPPTSGGRHCAGSPADFIQGDCGAVGPHDPHPYADPTCPGSPHWAEADCGRAGCPGGHTYQERQGQG